MLQVLQVLYDLLVQRDRIHIINFIKKGFKMKKDQNLMAMDAQRMTSLEIAAVTGKPQRWKKPGNRNVEEIFP